MGQRMVAAAKQRVTDGPSEAFDAKWRKAMELGDDATLRELERVALDRALLVALFGGGQ